MERSIRDIVEDTTNNYGCLASAGLVAVFVAFAIFVAIGLELFPIIFLGLIAAALSYMVYYFMIKNRDRSWTGWSHKDSPKVDRYDPEKWGPDGIK